MHTAGVFKGNHAIFLDTSFLSESHLEDLLPFLQSPEPKYITDRVYSEIKRGYLNDPSDERFRYIFQTKGKLKSNIRIVSFENCKKERFETVLNNGLLVDFSQRKICLKKNTLLCSAYYSWVGYAINPSVITDPFRHTYNEGLAVVQREGDPHNQISMKLGSLRQKELDQIHQFRKEEGITGKCFGASVIKTARMKRLKDFKKNTFGVTDCQIILAALLYVCIQRAQVMVLTCDKDLVDIKDNLLRSILEHYSINRILAEKLKRSGYKFQPVNILDRSDPFFSFGEPWNEFKFLYRKEIFEELSNTLKRIKNSEPSGGLTVSCYDRNDRRIYGVMGEHIEHNLPTWLMDFFLEYRGRFECYSLYKPIELKYPIQYIMDPTRSNRVIYFDVRIKEKPFYVGFLENCEDICAIAKREREAPSGLSGFV